MTQTLYTWEVTQKRNMPDGSTKIITARQTGPRPPHSAKNVRRVGAEKPATEAELARLEEQAEIERQAALKRHEDEKAHKAKMAEQNRQAAEQLQRAAGGSVATVEVSETVHQDIHGQPIENTNGEPMAATVEKLETNLSAEMTKAELAEIAKARGIEIPSSWTKAQILEAIGAKK